VTEVRSRALRDGAGRTWTSDVEDL